MDTRKLQIIETRDKSPGMEGAVHIGTSKERLIPYVGREVAAEMVRRWNAYPELVDAIRQVASHWQAAKDEGDKAYALDLATCQECQNIIRTLLETLKA